MIRKIKRKLYFLLVEKAPRAMSHYQEYIRISPGRHQHFRLLSWMYLLFCLLRYGLFSSRFGEEKKSPFLGSESALAQQPSPKELVEKLEQYDVISFDVFDTLLFRPLAEPVDLFHLVGEKLGYLQFAQLRIDAERKVRRQREDGGESTEVTLSAIYQCLSQETGIAPEEGEQLELQTERDLLFANPYLKQVVELLWQRGKKLIAISDTYFPREVLTEILKDCGYPPFAAVFSSCSEGKGKGNGELFKRAREKIGVSLSYIHIGDNPQSDFVQPKKQGFAVWPYPSVSRGKKYRPASMSVIRGSAYQGVANAHLYCGEKVYSPAYEYGFLCGGILVLGYCCFIHQYVQEHQIDKVLFFSRDGEILKRVYSQLFPDSPAVYVRWSRAAAAKLTLDRFRYDYFRKFLHHQVGSGKNGRAVLKSMDLSFLEEELENFPLDEPLDAAKAARLQELLSQPKNWEKIRSVCQSAQKAAKLYFQDILQGTKTVCAVDVGWAGSGAVLFSYLVEEVWKFPCTVTGLLAGTNGRFTEEPNASEVLLASGKLVSYLFSQEKNREYWKFHSPGSGHNVYLEMLLAAPEPFFRGFSLTAEGTCQLLLEEDPLSRQKELLEIRQGVLDFVKKYTTSFQRYPYLWNFSGSDAYAPFSMAVQNRKYMQLVLGNCPFDSSIAGDSHKIQEDFG